jgi:hypothetical protein
VKNAREPLRALGIAQERSQGLPLQFCKRSADEAFVATQTDLDALFAFHYAQ